MRIGLAQLSVTDGNVDANVQRADAMIREAASDKADIVLLPELWTTGYVHEQWGDIADLETPRVAQHLAALAAELGVTIGGSMVTRRDDGALANRFSLTFADGRDPVFYDKSHLFSPMREKEFLAPGTERVHTHVGNTPAALSICYDLRFPGMYRSSAHEGTELYLVASAWPEPRCGALRTLATARAVENQAFLALCNRAGPAADGSTFCGGSMIVAPAGDIVLDLGSSERVAVADVNMRMVTIARSMLAVLQDDIQLVDSPIAR